MTEATRLEVELVFHVRETNVGAAADTRRNGETARLLKSSSIVALRMKGADALYTMVSTCCVETSDVSILFDLVEPFFFSLSLSGYSRK